MKKWQLSSIVASLALVAAVACESAEPQPPAQGIDEPAVPYPAGPKPTIDPPRMVPAAMGDERDAAAAAEIPAANTDATAPEADARRDAPPLAGQTPPPALQPLMSMRGNLLLDESFSLPTWKKTWSFYAGNFQVIDGILRAEPIPGNNHPSEANFFARMHDIIVQLRFRLDGANYLGLQLADTRVPHHVAAIMANRMNITINRVTGWGGTTKYTGLDRRALPNDPGRWFNALVELRGNEILVQIDGHCLAYGRADGLDVDKTRISLISRGSVALYDEVKIWAANPDPNWETRRTQVLADRGQCQ